MATNPYVNKVELADGTTLIDISDTTAEATDVKQGVYFYASNGERIEGELGDENLFIAKYGISTWAEVFDAYKNNKIVYCRASSGSNPASGSQTRMAFMAYVNNETNPTEIEFQYYRSVATHTASQLGDQVYVYKLNKTNGWSVTVREAGPKIVAGTGISLSYSNGTLTISLAS